MTILSGVSGASEQYYTEVPAKPHKSCALLPVGFTRRAGCRCHERQAYDPLGVWHARTWAVKPPSDSRKI